MKEGSTVLDPGAGVRGACAVQKHKWEQTEWGASVLGGAKAVRRHLGVLRPEERHFLNFVITTVENH